MLQDSQDLIINSDRSVRTAAIAFYGALASPQTSDISALKTAYLNGLIYEQAIVSPHRKSALHLALIHVRMLYCCVLV